jgi:hypothetical protein
VTDEALVPLYLLGVTAGYAWRNGVSEKNYPALLNDLASKLEFPQMVIFVPLEDENAALLGRFSKMAGAQIFRKG